MRLLANLVGLFLLIAASCCESTVARGQESTAEIRVQDYYPGYHLLRMSERDPDTRAFLFKHFKGSDPSIIRADFDGNGQPDCAMLLKGDTSAAAKLVVLLCDAPGRCRRVYEVDITGYSNEAYLSRLPIGSRVAVAGSVDGEKEPPPVKLATGGIQVTYFEKGQGALYWDKKLKKIVEVSTGE